MNRSLLIGVAIILYVASINVWIYMLASGMLTNKQNRLSSYLITGVMILISYIDLKTVTHIPHHTTFNDVAFMCILANFGLNILNHMGILGGRAASLFCTFNGLIFVLTCMILISGVQHGYFSKKYKNG